MSINIPCSPYEEVHGLVYFPRMVDKIRLHAAGILPEDYIPTLGRYFDMRCCSLLGVDYDELADVVSREGLSNEGAFLWAIRHGNELTNERIEIWNAFMKKRGWRDEATPTLRRRLREIGCEDRTEIQTIFDCMDLEEGRPLLHALESLVS